MSPPLAFGWHIWTRHRRGLTLCAVYWLLLVIAAHSLPVQSLPSKLVALLVLAPCIAAFGYLILVFSIGLDAHLEIRESGFPVRMMTLPLRTRSLIGWPMLWGTSVLALAWLTLPWGTLQSPGVDLTVLIWLPALVLVVTLAWLQVLVWSPLPLPGLRLLLVGPVLGVGLIGPLILLVDSDIPAAIGCGLLVVQLPIAYLTAVYGVSRARRGDVPRWEWPGWPMWLRWTSAQTIGSSFASPARAQLWYEWRRHGLSFPLVMAGTALLWLPLLPWIAAFLETASRDSTALLPPSFLVDEIGGLWLAVAHLLVFPPLMASAVGLDMGKFPGRDRACVLSSFLATRPASAAMLIGAKFEMAALSTLAGWAALLLGFVIWFALGGKAAEMTATMDALRQRHAAGPFWTCLGLLVAGAVALTWLQMVQGLWLGLVREWWRIVAALSLFGSLIAAIPFCGWLANSSQYWPTLVDLLPWLAGGVAALKSLLALWSVRALKRRIVLSPVVLWGALAIWSTLVVGLFGVLYWLLPAGQTSVSAIVLGIALLVPLTRLALAPLALDWNRHR
jgi:hypothetical protein